MSIFRQLSCSIDTSGSPVNWEHNRGHKTAKYRVFYLKICCNWPQRGASLTAQQSESSVVLGAPPGSKRSLDQPLVCELRS